MAKQTTTTARGHRHEAPRLGMPGALLAATLGTAVLASVAAGGLAVRGRAAAQSPQPRTVAAVLGQARFAADATATTAAPVDDGATAPTDSTPQSQPAAETGAAAAASTPADASVAPPSAAERTAAAPTPASAASPPPAVAEAARLQGGSALSNAPPPLEREHTVAAGETLSSIAQQYGLSTDTLVVNNAGVTDRDLLKVGQGLRVPPHDGLLYEVRLGESLQMIARRFGVEPSAILGEPANRLASADLVRQGQVLLVPGAKLPPPTVTPVAIRPVGTLAPAMSQRTPAVPAARTAVVTPAAAPARTSSSGWRWPITGPLSSYFGPSHPLGIDIDLYARDGAPVTAARGGVVTFAGGNPCCSYGYYVEIDHGDGFRTIYAHFQSPPPVRIGQQVAQGQVVGYAGTTGYSTGTHLHFEIRRGGVPVNPLAYLP